MRIVFLGTPDFAVGALDALIGAGHEILAVVTQPDKPKGRSKELICPPVKEYALSRNIPVMQPVRIKAQEAMEELLKYKADIFIVAAFGQILSQEILDMPPLGCLCIHASLLPEYRGASPIQHVILDGKEKSGITIMQMDAGIDTGDMLYKKEVLINREDTFQSLHDKLMAAGGEAIVEALSLLARGELFAEKQDEALSCYAPLIRKDKGKMDFTKDAKTLERLVKGMNPWPSAYTFYKGRQLKIWEAWADESDDAYPYAIREIAKDHITIGTGKGNLLVYSLQLEGKKRMSAHDFLLGVKLQEGEMLTEDK